MVLKALAAGLLLFSNYANAASLQKGVDLQMPVPYSVEFATNDLLVAKEGTAGTWCFKIFDAHTGAPLSSIEANTIPLSYRNHSESPSLEFITSSLPGAHRSNTELLATGTWPTKIISVWNMRTGEALWHFEFPYGKDLRLVRLSNDGTTVLACAEGTGAWPTARCSLLNRDGIFKDLELSPEAPTAELKLQAPLTLGHLASSPNFSVDGTRFVLVRDLKNEGISTGQEAIVFDATTGEALQRRRFTDTFVTFSDDLKLLAATIDYRTSQTIDALEIETGMVLSRASKRLGSNRGFRSGSYTVLFSDRSTRDAKHGTQEKSFHFFDAPTGKIHETVINLGHAPLESQFAQKELDVAFAYDPTANITYIFDLLDKGEKRQEIPGYSSGRASGGVPASPDGKTVVLRTKRGELSIWSWK